MNCTLAIRICVARQRFAKLLMIRVRNGKPELNVPPGAKANDITNACQAPACVVDTC